MGIMKKKSKLLLLRILLAVLIVANMTVIFLFSAQSGEESDQTSGTVTEIVAQVTVKDFESKPQEEQAQIIQSLHPPVRKLAHMAEFGSLASLLFLFLLTWKGGILWRYAASLGMTFFYACTDELHQMLSDARGPQFSDVLIDTLGGLICCTLLLLACFLIKRYQKKGKKRKPMQITRYNLTNERLSHPLRIALASDLHGEDHTTLLKSLRDEHPDLILIPGDLMEDHQLGDPDASGYAFLRSCAALAPTFYSLGNHEIGCYHSEKPWIHPTPTPLSEKIKKQIRDTGAILLDNECIRHAEFSVCGLTSGINGTENRPDADVLRHFAEQGGFRILLCHHPEYFVPHIKLTDIELTVCGHAHGGQWRIFGRGIYAPGQGLFPKYTSGVIDGRCVISRGLGNHTRIPRIFNRPELVMICYNR